MDRKAFESIGLGKRSSQTIAASTVGMLDRMFGTDEQASAQLNSGDESERRQGALSRLGRNRFIMRTFNLQNEAQAAEVNQLLKTLGDPKTSERERQKAQKELSSIQEGSTELGNLKKINESTAGSLDVLQNLRQTTEELLGSRIAPAMETAQNALLRIDQMIAKILGVFGMTTPAEDLENAISGKDVLNSTQIANMTPEQRQAALAQLNSQKSALDSKIDAARRSGRGVDGYAATALERQRSNVSANIKGLTEASMSPSQIAEAVNAALSKTSSPMSSSKESGDGMNQMIDLLKRNTEHAEKTARGVRGFGTLPASSSKTMGN